MSDASVEAKTGRNWKQWFAILDKAGAKKMTHQEIVKFLNTDYDVGPWWQQMLTVTYEQARGLRELHQKPGGYEISVSRTINAPVARAYKLLADEKTRTAWLDVDDLRIRKATPNKCLRMTWPDGKTNLEIYFASKAVGKTQIVVQHRKLRDARAAGKMKSFWADALDLLREEILSR